MYSVLFEREFDLPRTSPLSSIHPSIRTLIPPRGQYDYLSWERHLFACACSDGSILAWRPPLSLWILFTCRASEPALLHEQYQNTGLIKAHYASAWNSKHPCSLARSLMQRFWLDHSIAILSASGGEKRGRVHVRALNSHILWNLIKF
jgi:hypothetical protein